MAKPPRTLTAIRPSAALRELYAARIDREVEAMHRSLVYWLRAQWRKNAPELAMDASPARELKKLLRKRGRLWRARFAELGPELGKYFATKASRRVDGAMEAMLRKHGFSIRFKLSRPMNDVMQATIAEQVNLISSVADEHLKRVEGIVMRSIQTGRDLHQLSTDLEDALGITKRRADGIARSQSNMATATMARTRNLELGITEAFWLHSAGGQHPRPSHVAFSGKRYNIAEGAYLDGKWTHPGVEPNCRCVSRPILPELGQ